MTLLEGAESARQLIASSDLREVAAVHGELMEELHRYRSANVVTNAFLIASHLSAKQRITSCSAPIAGRAFVTLLGSQNLLGPGGRLLMNEERMKRIYRKGGRLGLYSRSLGLQLTTMSERLYKATGNLGDMLAALVPEDERDEDLVVCFRDIYRRDITVWEVEEEGGQPERPDYLGDEEWELILKQRYGWPLTEQEDEQLENIWRKLYEGAPGGTPINPGGSPVGRGSQTGTNGLHVSIGTDIATVISAFSGVLTLGAALTGSSSAMAFAASLSPLSGMAIGLGVGAVAAAASLSF